MAVVNTASSPACTPIELFSSPREFAAWAARVLALCRRGELDDRILSIWPATVASDDTLPIVGACSAGAVTCGDGAFISGSLKPRAIMALLFVTNNVKQVFNGPHL